MTGAPRVDSVAQEAAEAFEGFDVYTPDREKVHVEFEAPADFTDLLAFMQERQMDRFSVNVKSHTKETVLVFGREGSR